jgi:hypothetical protein
MNYLLMARVAEMYSHNDITMLCNFQVLLSNDSFKQALIIVLPNVLQRRLFTIVQLHSY